MKFPLEQLVPVVSCPATVHPREESTSSFSIASFKVLEDSGKVEAWFLKEMDAHQPLGDICVVVGTLC